MIKQFTLTIAALLSIHSAYAEILAKNDETSVTKAEFFAEVERSVPADRRAGWLSSPKNIATMLEQVLVYKTLAARAEKQQLEKQPEAAAEIATARARTLAKAYTEYLDNQTKLPDFDKRATELYLLDPQRFTNPDQFDTSHLLFNVTCEGGKDRAMERAKAARERLIKGEKIEALASELSDDPAAKTNQGHQGLARANQFTGEYAEVITRMKPGEISQPFSSPHGIHVVKLNAIKKGERAPMSVAKPVLVNDLREQHLIKQRQEITAAIRNSPNIQYEPGFLPKLQKELANKFPQ